MPDSSRFLSRSQLFVYGAIAIAIILIGARWLRSEPTEPERFGGVAGVEQPEFALDTGGGQIVVHVAGAVREPGVYELAGGSRVADAIERAGGADGSGAPDSINLAAKLADGQQVVVPSQTASAAVPSGAATVPEGPISLGSATVEQLDTIEGIGPVTAQDIVAYRDEQGGLSSVDELDQITGIGPATMEALRNRLQP